MTGKTVAQRLTIPSLAGDGVTSFPKRSNATDALVIGLHNNVYSNFMYAYVCSACDYTHTLFGRYTAYKAKEPAHRRNVQNARNQEAMATVT